MRKATCAQITPVKNSGEKGRETTKKKKKAAVNGCDVGCDDAQSSKGPIKRACLHGSIHLEDQAMRILQDVPLQRPESRWQQHGKDAWRPF